MDLRDLRIFTEPQQGASYDTLLAVAQRAEALGFGAFFRSDHYLVMGSGDGLPGPTDAWITLAGLARETSTIRLGTLVSPVTFRSPGLLAISVAQVDQMSGGRVELGLGAGWYEAEHTAYAFDFPPLGRRFDMLEDQLAIIDGLWRTPAGQTFSYEGAAHSVTNSPGLPKPAQSPLPIVMGGGGPRRTPALAARYAAEFNTPFVPLERFTALCDGVRAACAAIGRETPPVFSAALVVCAGADEAEVARRAAAIGRAPAELRANGAAGTVAEVADTIRRWRDAGAERVYLQVLDLEDLEHLDLIAREVAPAV
ncbi:MAG: LLM class F420-dependent oxidoreductase [Acidimicrobiaceae bacterium]|nr:LLM class F420-dependent oxidoreductase [Ilumatobacter sp.]MCB9380627.1 LLM class F420-dependent oxidoreductase [Acidimicrobiaceae bacterium]MCO5328776.1 LLM class F420-dependent oxidoreductase [Ilumatobacteraceae bacterium]